MPNPNDIQVNFIGDTTSIEASITRLKKLMQSFNGSVRTLSNNLGDAIGSVDSAIRRNADNTSASTRTIVDNFKAQVKAAKSSAADIADANTMYQNKKSKYIVQSDPLARSAAQKTIDYQNYLADGNDKVRHSVDALLEAEKRLNLFRREQAQTSVKFGPKPLQEPVFATRVQTDQPRGRNRASQSTGGSITTSAYGSANTSGTITALNDEGKAVTTLNSKLQAMTDRKKSLLLLNNELAMGETNAALAARKQAQALQESTKAAQEKAKADAEATRNSSSARYALYDIARAYASVSATILASAGYSVKAAADMESAFTNVQRTLGSNISVAGVNNIRKSLIGLSEQIPKTFAEVTTIATLGNQLGIAENDIVSFTKTVSQFSTVTGISIENTAQAFGLLGNLLDVPTSKFNNLASAISLVGVNSVATETQIISVAEQIAAGANGAGFAADQVIGLSGALASLKVSPEQSRSSLTTYFNALNTAVANGGPELEKFSKITGLAGTKIESLVRSGTGGKEVFMNFLGGLGKTDSVGVTKALDDLGLAGLRVDNTFRRLSQNPLVLGNAFADATSGMMSGTEAQRQYALVADDLNASFIMLQNALSNFVAQLGSDVVPILSVAVTSFKDFVVNVRSLADNGPVKAIFGLVGGFVALTGAILAYKSVALVAAGTTLALERATALLGSTKTAGAFSTLFAAIKDEVLGFSKASVVATGSTAALTGATSVNTAATIANTESVVLNRQVVGSGTVVITASTVATEVNTVATVANTTATGFLSTAITIAKGALSGFITLIKLIPGWGWALIGISIVNALGDVLRKSRDAAIDAGLGLTELAARADAGNRSFTQLTSDAGLLTKALGEVAKSQDAIKQNNDINKKTTLGNIPVKQLAVDVSPVSANSSVVKEQYKALDDELSKIISVDNIGEITKQLKDQGITSDVLNKNLYFTAKALRDVGAQKLSKDMSDAHDAVIKAKTALNEAKKSAEGAAKPIRTLSDYASDLASIFKRSFSLRFDNQSALDDITTGFDNLRERVNSARTELLGLSADKSVKEYFLSIANAYGDTLRAGQLTAEIAKINSDIANSQANASTELKGNSAAAIKNRATMRGMVTSYDAYIQSLAESGASQATLQKAIRDGKADFINQATQLGYNSADLATYGSHFDDLATAVTNVPKNVTVTANLNPALQAMNEFVAKAKASGSAAGNSYGVAYAEATLAAAQKAERDATNAAKKGQNERLMIQINDLKKLKAQAGTPEQIKQLNQSIADVQSRILLDSHGKAYASGGFTGRGRKYDVAGVVHKGEYVFPQSQVNQSTGLPYTQMSSPSFFSGGASATSSGMMMVSLSPEDRGLLRQIGGSGEVVLYANNEAIARSSSAGNKAIIASGGRL